MASLKFISSAEIVFATVPEAPPAWKNTRATSWPAPISANVPYLRSSRLIVSALRLVVSNSFFSLMVMDYEVRGAGRNWYIGACRSCVREEIVTRTPGPGNSTSGLPRADAAFRLEEHPKAATFRGKHEELFPLDARRAGGADDFFLWLRVAAHRISRGDGGHR